MTNHHFDLRDTIISFMGRCIGTKLSSGLTRSQSFSMCHKEFKMKKQKKQLK